MLNGGRVAPLVLSLSIRVFVMAVTKSDLYQVVTDSIVAKLEAGVTPWSPSWSSARASRPLRSCGLPYNGVNVLVLWLQAMESGYSSPYWLTYKQAEKLGGQVRKGEKSTRVVYWGSFGADKGKESGDGDGDGESKKSGGVFLKSYCVFNACQVDGLPAHFYPSTPDLEINQGERLEVVDAWAQSTGATITEAPHGRAFYSRSDDAVVLPPFSHFSSPEAFASVLAHELVHWSGAAGRLDRQFGKRFGDRAYAVEELVAELGAAFVLADLGVCSVPRDDHASYLASWLQVLKSDKRAIFTAASAASKAAEFLGSFAGLVASGDGEDFSSECV